MLESKWGYLFCVVIVSLLLFLQEVFDLTMEIKYGMDVKKARKASATSDDTDAPERTSEHKSNTAKKPSAKKTVNTTKTAGTSKKASTTKANTTKATGTSSKARTAKTVNKKMESDKKEANSEEE